MSILILATVFVLLSMVIICISYRILSRINSVKVQTNVSKSSDTQHSSKTTDEEFVEPNQLPLKSIEGSVKDSNKENSITADITTVAVENVVQKSKKDDEPFRLDLSSKEQIHNDESHSKEITSSKLAAFNMPLPTMVESRVGRETPRLKSETLTVQENDIETINKRSKISSRFSLESIRDNVPYVIEKPSKFLQYEEFDFDKPTTVFQNWENSVEDLGNQCEMLVRGLHFAINHHGTSEAESVIKCVENFIERFHVRTQSIKTQPFKDAPWNGKERHHLSVTLPYMLAHYIIYDTPTMRETAANLILNLISSPKKSLGVEYEDIDMLQIAGPWILAHYVKNSLEKAVNDPNYKKALKALAMHHKKKRRSPGAHKDGSFYSRNMCLSFGYLDLINKLSSYLIDFDKDFQGENSPMQQLVAARKIILHPTVPLGNYGLFGREKDITCESLAGAEMGARVMPFSGYFRYFTPTLQFSMRAQTSHLAFYEADKNTNDMAQYWVQYRTINRFDSSSDTQFPNAGFICKASQRELLKIKLGSSTVEALRPKYAKSFVMQHQQYGFLYQEYEIEQFGKYRIKEFIQTNEECISFLLHIEIESRETESLVYYDINKTAYTIPPKGKRSLMTSFQLDLPLSQYETKDAPFPSLSEYTVDDVYQIREHRNAKAYVLYQNEHPVIACLSDWETEKDTITLDLAGKKTNFRFDGARANQYVYDGSS
ncbi:unnamed protein product [Bemisia tabaci]|uniref:Uncharacterized protein n=1 Tax=Bemisia tabaci TaxID=7038 RepID=A0A9P0F7S5_BEMTA|nr:unnamed protein product [Bemisia tabaci]